MIPARRLLIVSEPASGDVDLGLIATAAELRTDEWFHVRRCSKTCEIPSIVADVAGRSGPIEILDFAGHGGPGQITIGDRVLFKSDEHPGNRLQGWEIVSAFSDHLRETACVRLLGCNTAGEIFDANYAWRIPDKRNNIVGSTTGRLLLLKLGMELGGHRTAFGTIEYTDHQRYQNGVFLPEYSFLFSSSAALDNEPPGTGTRDGNFRDLVKPYHWPISRARVSSSAELLLERAHWLLARVLRLRP